MPKAVYRSGSVTTKKLPTLGFDPGRSCLTCLTVVHALELGILLDQCDLQLYKETSGTPNNRNAKENADRY